METPLISIVMPAKNSGDFISECIDSIVFQTYNNWELLVVDDSSKDNTYAILREYEDKDKRIQVLKNKGEGIIEALRLAYSMSKGDFVTRMDSDDIMPRNKLDEMSGVLIQQGEGNIALGLVKYFCEGEIGEGFLKYEKWLNGLISSGNNFSEIYKECVIPSPCWMLYRSDFEKAGAFNSAIYPEDYDLAFRFKEQGYHCIPSDKILHYWRDYETRTSRTHHHYADNSFIEIKTHYFLKHDYDKEKSLVLWGAGKKGKKVAQLLLKRAIPFHWICDNPKKIGKEIYNQKLLPFNELDKIENTQSIVTVANKKSQKEIKSFFEKRNQLSMQDYFFFC
ncbi:MAG: glycosyltransferase family 2 protein [Vicingus serpentipes]|nr:glycosyltransferase family 2 protein [Vicingus serpentipes]